MIRDTSKLTYLELVTANKLNDNQKKVLNVLMAFPNSTDMEICSKLGINDPNLIRPRRNELYHKGVVKEGLKRKCTITGRLAYTWFI